jgi:hypothetical protein
LEVIVMRKKTAVEVTVMLAAQQMVDRWLKSPARGPFQRAVSRELESIWTDHINTEHQRKAFGRIANAIRLGEGHAIANPGPLLRIARQMLRDSMMETSSPDGEGSGEMAQHATRTHFTLRPHR